MKKQSLLGTPLGMESILDSKEGVNWGYMEKKCKICKKEIKMDFVWIAPEHPKIIYHFNCLMRKLANL